MTYLRFLREWERKLTRRDFKDMFGENVGQHIWNRHIVEFGCDFMRLVEYLDRDNLQILQDKVDIDWSVYAADRVANLVGEVEQCLAIAKMK